MKENPDDEFRICPNCGYKKGFHLCFKKTENSRFRIGLICPSCGQSYNIDWITSDIPELDVKWEDNYG
ncbi:hypothetical protein Metev_0575 [Methanohalobium evestigatum Z-7303]|uniref:Uncharacterized protein n=1 Tax=Methanohalobium evestigatum (strain ATCC BAA-1072 / DSM 3721 / NBRC 107634 / OCM 161 / Z-7303) TaxID=644295 RepID=D7E8E4_METEZ|nr:hypothetical protein [Methanohalobium evestigatum]ADI73486.1 hypothetical protein Metev_0575 [Methanohalobium evestigatum Z-7303]